MDEGESHDFGRNMVWKEGYLQLYIGWLPGIETPPDGGLMYDTRIRIRFEDVYDNAMPQKQDFGAITVENFKYLVGEFVTVTGHILIISSGDQNEVELFADDFNVL
ncbi:hypothetical protein HAU32_10525 [Weissella confusa]|uniref:YopX protein domain-containing protein n=1 Tax=Weissella fermenti TaxID=2987699 RepID=A0ABT6D6N4_9LACO|nr:MULTISPECIES: hypothetical protein [Weissella]MBJ7689378.1 hypothetical protein [Weissella confusa]MCW0928014.1 hypothetical protein [Weissella sp. LMG 11983]MDF9300604.1 hypothetical protein [Weissella sp. BK2]